MEIACIVIVVLLILYVLSLRGRAGHPGLKALQGWHYAHRGLHGNGVPENSMEAFRLALENGYGIELDIHLMKDDNLAVIHDSSLLRTAGADVQIEDLTTEDICKYSLEGTQEKIPLFTEVLQLYRGQAPLIIELKTHQGNHVQLAAAAVKAMEGYDGPWCMESFDPRAVHALRKNHPHVIRGQLTENFFKSPKNKLHPVLKWVMTTQILNFTTRPDFIAYRVSDRKRLGTFLCRKLWGLQGVTWTVRNPQDHADVVAEGWISIFEGFRP